MTLWWLSLRNLRRHGVRTVLTVGAVAVAIVAFVLLRTITGAYFVFVESSATDRLATRHKVGARIGLPYRFLEHVRELPGVRAATGGAFVGGTTSAKPDQQVAAIAVDHTSFVPVFDEVELDPAALQRWQANRQGAIVGDTLARTLGIGVGDRLTLDGSVVRGRWDLQIEGIYTTSRPAFERSSLMFRWDYFNETLPASERERIDLIFSRIDDASASASLAKAVDAELEGKGVPTLTMSQRAMNLALLGGVSALLRAVDLGTVIMLLIVLMILANTIAMGVRERTSEYAVMRAVGFRPLQIAAVILTEGVALGFISGIIGAMAAYPVVELGLGRWLEENVANLVEHFRIHPNTYAAALGASLALGVVASVVPAVRMSRLSVVDALRRIN